MTLESEAAIRRQGVFVLAGFGFLWGLAAASGLDGPAALATRVGALLISTGLIVVALVSGRNGDSVRRLPDDWRRTLGWVNGLEALVIVAVVVIGISTGAPSAVPPVVCVVVGLHFLPLATIFAEPVFRPTGIALVAVGLVGAAALLGDEAAALSRTITGAGAATVLWATAVILLLTHETTPHGSSA